MTGAECLLRTLLNNQIDVCFMNPGTSEMQFVSALDRVPGMRAVLGLFEGVCSGAADGYARMLRKPAATLLHLGPGLGNGLSNFHNARKARSPIVSIVGDHATAHKNYDAPLSADVSAFARTVSDWVRVVQSAGEMGRAAADAVLAAYGPPGQVAQLIVPADFSWSESGDPVSQLKIPARGIPDEKAISNCSAVLQRLGAAAGIIMGGETLVDPGLTAAHRVSVATKARIFWDRNTSRSSCGGGRFLPERIAYFPERAEAQFAGLQHVFLIEAKEPVSFFAYPGRRSTLLPENCTVTALAGVSDNGVATLEALADRSRGASPSQAPWHRVEFTPDSNPLTTDCLGSAIAALLPEDAIISEESVSSSEAIVPRLPGALRHDFLPVTGGSIGQGLPVAVGAAVACPHRKVVALEADGSGMYTFQALWTMARENLNITIVVFANRRYRILDIELHRTGSKGFGPQANNMIDISRPDLDWVKLAGSMGVEATRARTSREFADQFSTALLANGPRLIEAVL